jgi:ATP-dependent Clp protease ATP-binding subunit ClpA
MRDFREAKAMAQTLRASLAAMGFRITVSQSLELIAQSFGVADWNTLAAAIRTQAPAAKAETGSGLSSQLEATLNQAFAYAWERRHELVTVEHLLFFLLADPDASRVMTACGVDLRALREKLSSHIDNEMRIHTTIDGEKPRPALAFQRILQRAVFHVQQAGRPPVGSLNVLVALFSEKESRAVKLLNEQGMSRLDAVNYISHGLTKGGGRAPPDSPAST